MTTNTIKLSRTMGETRIILRPSDYADLPRWKGQQRKVKAIRCHINTSNLECSLINIATNLELKSGPQYKASTA
uniref:Transposase n=1 Tax=Heterorhabditis bacteriophora TaxID=37862 RepID=A0A1I7WNZ5_HETBA